MSYDGYDRDVRQRYRVQIRSSWPAGVRFGKPGSINGLSEITALHAALTSGDCCWSKMSTKEVEELEKALKAAGPKKKAPRRDKGEKRGKRASNLADEDTDEDTAPRARKKSKLASKLPPSFKSAPTVSDSDEESERDEES